MSLPRSSSNLPDAPRRCRLAPRRRRHVRRGASVVWFVVAMPAIFAMLVVVSEIGHLWLAREELLSALEASALAGAKQWESGGVSVANNSLARDLAVEMAQANTIHGEALMLTDNDDGGSQTNSNASATGNLIFGAVTGASPATFDATNAPNCGAGQEFGVRAQASIPVDSLWNNLLGVPLGPFTISAAADAVGRCSGETELIRVGTYTPP